MKRSDRKSGKRRPSREEMEKRSQHSYDNRGKSGKYGNIYKGEMDRPVWSPAPGEHEVIIFPYWVPTKENSVFRTDDRFNDRIPEQELEEAGGFFDHKLTVMIHGNIGVNKDQVLCLATLGKKCPICEEKERLMNEEGLEWNDEEVSKLSPTKRALYNIVVLDSRKDRKLGIQIWEASHKYIEDVLSKLSKKKDRETGEIIGKTYNLPEDGNSVTFERVGKGISTEYTSVAIEKVGKSSALTDEEMEELYSQTVNFEDAIEIKTYEELHTMFHGDDAPETKTKGGKKTGMVKKKKKRKDEEPEEEEEEEPEEEPEEEEEEEEEADLANLLDEMTRAELKTYIKDNDLDVKVFKSMSDDDVRNAILIAEQPKADDYDNEEGEEESSTRKSGKSKVGKKNLPKCFGKECNQRDECDDCDSDVYEACYEKSEA